MPDAALTPPSVELHLEHLSVQAGRIRVVAEAKRPFASCPGCAQPSGRIHSHYTRHLADLPWHGVLVEIELRAHRFFCASPGCTRRIFTERLPETAARYARRTCRLASVHRLLALALGGEAGFRLARELGLSTSADTLLRRLHESPAGFEVLRARVLAA